MAVERGLVLLYEEQVVAAGLANLLTEGTLAKERIAGHDASLPVDALEQIRGNGEFRLGFLGWLIALDGLLSEHDALLVQKSTQGVDGTTRGVKGKAAALGFAVERISPAPRAIES